MAKYDYSGVKATAQRLIDRFGRTITRKVVTNSGTEWNPDTSMVPETIVGVSTNFAKNEIDGTLIRSTDKKLLTYDEIVLTDIIVDDSIEYTVIDVNTVNPGDTKLIYKIQLRR